ncbi:MAG: hypothetical protein ACJAS4_000507 [Bacteriovoracaceae bacterium]|jgi:hypothetical protein
MSEEKALDVREVKVPLTVDEIKEFFTNKEILYLVNYKESELKGVVFLTYLSNLDLPAEINFTGSSFEEKEELIRIYMETRNILSCETLRLNVAKVLLEYRGINTTDIFVAPCFSDEEVIRFNANNSALLDKWEQFIESTTLYAQTTVPELEESCKLKENAIIVEDQMFIGANVVNMFSIQSFYELFLSVPYRKEIVYFKYQFEEYMFRGKNFFSFFNCDENLIYKTFLSHINGEIDIDLIHGAGEEARTLLGE